MGWDMDLRSTGYVCVCVRVRMCGCMYVCMHVCVYVCMYVCTYIYTLLFLVTKSNGTEC